MKRSISVLVAAGSAVLAVFIFALYDSQNVVEFNAESLQVDATGMNLSVLVCNNSILPLSLEGIRADLAGSTGSYGTLVVPGNALQPLAKETLSGRIDFTDFGTMKNFVDWALNNKTGSDFEATTIIKGKLAGLVPYLEKKNYNMTEFSNILFGNGFPSCRAQNNDIGQQLTLAEARMSAAEFLYSDRASGGNDTGYNDVNTTIP